MFPYNNQPNVFALVICVVHFVTHLTLNIFKIILTKIREQYLVLLFMASKEIYAAVLILWDLKIYSHSMRFKRFRFLISFYILACDYLLINPFKSQSIFKKLLSVNCYSKLELPAVLLNNLNSVPADLE